jgi:hypothetical protein
MRFCGALRVEERRQGGLGDDRGLRGYRWRRGPPELGVVSKQRKAIAAWRDDGSLKGVDFRRDILPKPQGLPARMIAAAMGACISHGSKVRGGKLVPHRRHWKALSLIAE